MNKVGFNWVTPILCVSDLVNSLDHYEKVLGFDVSWAWSDEDQFDNAAKPTFACVCRGEISIFLCEKGQGHPGAWMSLNVSSLAELDSIYEEYQQSSAKIVEKPIDCPWGMREMLVQDLDQNTFRIGCPLDAC